MSLARFPGVIEMKKPEARARDGEKIFRILIVDDHPIVREGLALHLATRPDLECCGEAEDIAGAMAAIEATRPDVAIVDISLPQRQRQFRP